MARVRFHANFDHHVNRRACVAYKAGHELTVPRAHAGAAIAAGRAVAVEVPPRERRSPEPVSEVVVEAPETETDDG